MLWRVSAPCPLFHERKDMASTTKPIKIGFLSQFSPYDKKVSSGTCYRMATALRAVGDVEWIKIKRTLPGKVIGKICQKLRIEGRFRINFPITRLGAAITYMPIRDADLEKYDVVVAFFCVHILYKFRHIKTPIIYFSDTSLNGLIDYYANYSGLPGFNKRQALALERRSFQTVSRVVMSSRWAADNAVENGLDPAKAEIVELGANLEDRDVDFSSRCRPVQDTMHLLFLGVDWNRKGGDVAVETVDWLNSHGCKAVLDVVGVKPPETVASNPAVIYRGFKDKNDATQYRELLDLIRNADMLLLPTRAECAGIVFAESSAYGLPILTYDTGGVGNYVINGVNGYRLPLTATGKDFGSTILRLLKEEAFDSLSRGGRKLYEEKLNWNAWQERVSEIIRKML